MSDTPQLDEYEFKRAQGKYKKPHVPMHSAMHKAAEELRLEGKGSHDPIYEDSHKNK